jgi:hypothetical protein
MSNLFVNLLEERDIKPTAIRILVLKAMLEFDRAFSLSDLESQGKIKRPIIQEYATNNAHMYYILCKNLRERTALIEFLKKNQ